MSSGVVENTALHWADILVLVLYFVFVLAVGLWSSCKSDNRESISGYFLAGRDMHWLLVGASLFASNIGSGHFVGLAGSGASSGIGVAGFELNAIFILIVLGWIFVPVYISSGVYTMPEYLMKRFGGRRIRIYLSCLALLLYIFTKISADLYAGAIFIKQSLDWNLYASVGILLVIAAIFTAAGGLTAVIWTDAVQVVIMIIGAFILMILSLIKVGGYEAMVVKFYQSVPKNSSYIVPGTSCHIPPAHSMNLMRGFDQPDLPWTGMIFGLTISSVWYWCSDQVIVQRALAAKNFSHAKAGCVFAGCLKFLPMWLLVIPGMAARVLYADKIGCTDPEACKAICGSKGGCTNIAYPELVIDLMPPGLRGLMLACMMSALMSSLTSIFNSSATLFTMDVWKTLIRPKAGSVEQLVVGKLFVIVLVVISILWIPIIQNSSDSQLFNYIQAVTSYLAPPVCAVYVLAIFVDRVNEQGAFAGLMVGLVVGLIRFFVTIAYPSPLCGQPDYTPPIISRVHFLHFGILLFFITLAVTLGVSMMFPPPPPSMLHRSTFWSRHDEDKDKDPLHENIYSVTTMRIDSVQNSNGDSKDTANAPKSNLPSQPVPLWKKIIRIACGVDLDQVDDGIGGESTGMTHAEEKAFKSLDETPRTKRILDILAIVTMTLAVFYWAFFA